MYRLLHSLLYLSFFSTAFGDLAEFEEVYADSLSEMEETVVLEPVEEDQPETLFFEEEEIASTIDEEFSEIDSSYTDDVDLDEPSPIPPEFAYPPPPEEPPPAPPSEPAPLMQQELTVDLKNPIFSHGVITTEEGGVITGKGIRIQAQKIDYTNRIENGVRVQKIVAEGDLMMEYAGRAFVGSKLEYDFVNKTGTLWDGKTFVDIWFLGGDKIQLREDGSYYIYNAFVTTSESQENNWEIDAKTVKITQNQLLTAKNIKFRFFKVPLFWLPTFKSNLKMFTDPPIKYKLVWDKGLGPRLTMRYRFYSWKTLDLFFRLDYRLKKGFGGALESEYYAPEKNTTFVTRSYGAFDKTFPNETGPKRYRLQGLFHTQSQNAKTQFHVTWDKLSDTRMIGDFRSDDFEINTEKRTHAIIYHQLDYSFFNFHFQPRVNRFDSIDQELPLVSTGIRPFEFGSSGVLMNNYFNVGYLDYVYANDLRKEFHTLGLKSATHAGRLETRNNIYRPFSIGHFMLTPTIGIEGIFYSNNPSSHPVGQGIFTYGFTGETRFYRNYGRFRHMSEPYMVFQGLTSPTAGLSDHYYFDINDGYNMLNQLRLGWRNSFFNYKSCFLPTIFTDLYTNAFFGNRAFNRTFYKYYFDIGWNRPSYLVKGGVAWNNQDKVWDYTNIVTEFTINEDIAFGIEFRHRSKYDWRKADHENFILDVARPTSELLHSPLSDGRDTLLGKLFVRLAPKWSCQVQTRHGWGRKNEPAYNTGKIDLFTMLTCSWRLRLSYERMPNDNRFSGAVSLVK